MENFVWFLHDWILIDFVRHNAALTDVLDNFITRTGKEITVEHKICYKVYSRGLKHRWWILLYKFAELSVWIEGLNGIYWSLFLLKVEYLPGVWLENKFAS